MTDFKQRMYHGSGIGTVAIVAAVTGIVAGAAVVIASTMALKSERNRAKLKSILDSVKNKVVKSGKDIEDKVETSKNQMENKVVKGSKKIIKKVKKALVAKK